MAQEYSCRTHRGGFAINTSGFDADDVEPESLDDEWVNTDADDERVTVVEGRDDAEIPRAVVDPRFWRRIR